MKVAIWKVHWKNGLMGEGGFEFPLSLLGACLALLVTGPGRLSLDSLLFADRRELAIEDLQIALLGALGRR
jgi:putative oxidoreductase